MGGIPAGPLLLVSPHLDDAVFSCGALVERTEPIDVVTVFAGAPDPPRQGWWDHECGFASSAESMPARYAEDEAAFAGTPHPRSYLSLLELQYAEDRSGEEKDVIAAAIRDWVSEHTAGTVVLPAGAGCSTKLTARWLRRLRRESCSPPQHPDHLLVRDVGLQALRDSDAAPVLYEEVPYLWGSAADREAERAAAGGGRRAVLFELEVDRGRKAERIAAYASQIPYMSPSHGRLDEEEILPRSERYWRLERRASSTSS
jgi:LmbE family N-acetylglucosaminyl deacetylase